MCIKLPFSNIAQICLFIYIFVAIEFLHVLRNANCNGIIAVDVSLLLFLKDIIDLFLLATHYSFTRTIISLNLSMVAPKMFFSVGYTSALNILAFIVYSALIRILFPSTFDE